jgi:hypothetical protein
MYRYGANSTENDQILIFIIPIITNSTLGIVLDYKATLMGIHGCVAMQVYSVKLIALVLFVSFSELL